MKTNGDAIEFQARIPVWRETDVLVSGAARRDRRRDRAARNGAKTILLERYGFLGGTATASLVGAVHDLVQPGREETPHPRNLPGAGGADPSRGRRGAAPRPPCTARPTRVTSAATAHIRRRGSTG